MVEQKKNNFHKYHEISKKLRNTLVLFSVAIVLTAFLVFLYKSILSLIILATLTVILNIIIRHWHKSELEQIFNKSLREKQQTEAFVDNMLEIMNELKFGDFTISFKRLETFPRYKNIVDALKQTVESYTSTIEKLQKIAVTVAGHSHNILEIAGQQATGASQEAAAVSEITSTVEELARTASQIAENTEQVAHNSEIMENHTSEGKELTQYGMDSMKKMNERMVTINESAHQLGEQFQEIDKILSLITSIASETHILALNASIEAASAGESGARFSVIASEVRRLSDMSQEAVDEIKKIFGEFRKSIQGAILSTEQGTKEFKASMESTMAIKDKLEDISKYVVDINASNKEISLATQQQKSASDQVVESLKEISIVTRQNADALKKFNELALRLETLSREMGIMAQNFIVPMETNVKYLIKKLSKHPEIKRFKEVNISSTLSEILEQYTFIEGIFIVDINGKLISTSLSDSISKAESASILLPGSDTSSRPWFKPAVELKRPYFSNMYKSLITNEYCFTIANVIRDDSNNVIGVIAIDINISMWSKIS